jgi:pyridoxamine 5'-phosphate oxidase
MSGRLKDSGPKGGAAVQEAEPPLHREPTHPVDKFREWLDDAVRGGEPEPTAMALATADDKGNPDVRMVLLKHADSRGFVFYTNLGSPKAADLAARPRASLCFFWGRLGRQVRVSGKTEAVEEGEADAYFATRPRLSQLGAWASKQSRPMQGYYDLEKACAAFALRYPLGSVPRPPFWSGYRIVPDRIEFWLQKPFRRHERVVHVLENGEWRQFWLYP